MASKKRVPRTKAELIADLKAKRREIYKTRNGLRKLADEVEEQFDTCERGIDALGEAIDALSELA